MPLCSFSEALNTNFVEMLTRYHGTYTCPQTRTPLPRWTLREISGYQDCLNTSMTFDYRLVRLSSLIFIRMNGGFPLIYVGTLTMLTTYTSPQTRTPPPRQTLREIFGYQDCLNTSMTFDYRLVTCEQGWGAGAFGSRVSSSAPTFSDFCSLAPAPLSRLAPWL